LLSTGLTLAAAAAVDRYCCQSIYPLLSTGLTLAAAAVNVAVDAIDPSAVVPPVLLLSMRSTNSLTVDTPSIDLSAAVVVLI
jgi:hypothetical protein